MIKAAVIAMMLAMGREITLFVNTIGASIMEQIRLNDVCIIFPYMYKPAPRVSVMDTVCSNTQIPPKEKKMLSITKRMAGSGNCIAAIQPFDNSSRPMMRIPMVLSKIAVNHSFK